MCISSERRLINIFHLDNKSINGSPCLVVHAGINMAAIAYLYRVSPKATLIGNFSSSLDEPQLYGNVNKQQVHKIKKKMLEINVGKLSPVLV